MRIRTVLYPAFSLPMVSRARILSANEGQVDIVDELLSVKQVGEGSPAYRIEIQFKEGSRSITF